MGRASVLHEAVARAIAETRTEQPTDELVADCERAAMAAIGVVLAEAQRSIEEDIPDTTWQGGIPDTEVGRGREGMRDEVLAVLAALGDEAFDAPPPL